ncbi:MAG TPA: hypothetical protein VFV34_17715 [Blastocatellia bacterium]|nr:hypothetical protein [Blastocatellia bacterium]
MRRTILDQLRTIGLIGLIVYPSSAARPPKVTQQRDNGVKELPIACLITALTPEQRTRHTRLMKQLRESATESHETPDGYEIRFPGHTPTILAIAEFITLERACCPFFKFELEISGGEAPVTLRVTGPKGAKQVLKTAFGLN